MQKRQTMQFAVVKDSKEIKQIGRSSLLQPKANFKGDPDSIKWYPDRPKKKTN